MFGKPLVPLRRVALESRILRLAMLASDRFVGLEDARQVLICFDLNGKRVWERLVESRPFLARQIRVANEQIWLDCGDFIARFDFEGRELDVLKPSLREQEEIGQFLISDGNVAVSLYRTQNSEQAPRILRLSAEGKVQWQTDLPVSQLSFGGIVSMSADNNWEPEPVKAWRPRSWTADSYVNDGLLLAGDILLASYIDISSGIGFSYALCWSDGKLLWTSEMCPYSWRGIYGDGAFAFSVSGYGAARTFVLNPKGEKILEWPLSGSFCVSNQSEIWLQEQGNTTNAKCNFALLKPDGQSVTGAPLTSFEGCAPVLSDKGLIFWRAGQLMCIDQKGQQRVLNSHVGDPKSRVLSRTVLDENGTLIFATAGTGASHDNIESALWLGQGLAPLAQTPWPCRNGNPAGNPVWRPS